MTPSSWQAAVDIGGTFTDLLLVDRISGSFAIEKLLTTHDDPARAVREGLAAILNESSTDARALDVVVHATTLITNAVIERKGARIALLVTEGFRDLLTIGREHRYDMYDIRIEKPAPLVQPEDIFSVPERVLVDGSILRPIDEKTVAGIAREIRARGIEAIAVCLLHAYRHPGHEVRVRELLQNSWDEFRVTLSHEVVGELREYERATTTTVNAYVLSLVDAYLARLERDLDGMGYRGELLVMLSAGGLASTATARTFPVRLVESGPAAGALAAAEAGKRIGQQELLSFDMGGTTAKACIISDGRPHLASEIEVGRLRRFRRGSGLPLKLSSVELIEIGAGGGSHARLGPFGLLHVGPDSAGSEPGPVCYGRGGAIPTVTDADLLLGYLNAAYFLGGRMELDVDAARGAIEQHLARPLAVDAAEASWIVHEVVNENMSNAARIHAVETGAVLEDVPLFAFGGAGPVHAYQIAKNLGMKRVIAPLGAGVGSTIGLLAAPLAFDYVRSAVMPLVALDWQTIRELIGAMHREGAGLLRAAAPDCEVKTEIAADMRLIGQAHEITVPLPGFDPDAAEVGVLEREFNTAYSALFGRQPPDVGVEVVSWRVRVAGPQPDFPIASADVGGAPKGTGADGAIKGMRDAYFPQLGGYHATAVYDRYLLLPGATFEGPAIVEERESTFVMGPGGTASVDEHLNLLVEVR